MVPKATHRAWLGADHEAPTLPIMGCLSLPKAVREPAAVAQGGIMTAPALKYTFGCTDKSMHSIILGF